MIGIRSNPSWPGVLLLCINSLHLSHGTHLHSALKRRCRKYHKGNQAGEMLIPAWEQPDTGTATCPKGSQGLQGSMEGLELGGMAGVPPEQPSASPGFGFGQGNLAVRTRRAQQPAPSAVVGLEKSPAQPGTHPWQQQPGLGRRCDCAMCEAVPEPLLGTGSRLNPQPTAKGCSRGRLGQTWAQGVSACECQSPAQQGEGAAPSLLICSSGCASTGGQAQLRVSHTICQCPAG